MQDIIHGFLERNLPDFTEKIHVELTKEKEDGYAIHTENGELFIRANNFISFAHGLYEYLQVYCHVQYSWCGNRNIKIEKLADIDGVFEKKIAQKYRTYLNYCTLNYTASWWDFSKWEREIDFMAMNGINMALCVVGSEAVWYQTLLDFNCTEEEALKTVTGPAFWAWHLMTNIDSYMAPPSLKYIEERKALGQKILKRYIEFGIQPIQQGFCGHVPLILKEKYKNAQILEKKGWCLYPKTGQLDPLDPLFQKIGTKYLENMESIFGNYHYIACDPFHEGTPPKHTIHYIRSVGRAINRLYENFDPKSIWVMQGWTVRRYLITSIPKNRLLLLDLTSTKTIKYRAVRQYPVVAGMLHNFGGKNAMQGKLRLHAKNPYLFMKNKKSNVQGTGMFMEGLEQNPIVYDLQFHMLTQSSEIDFDAWLKDYILRRYGAYDETLYAVWQILLDTCYSDGGYEENEVGSTLASRPQPMPVRTGSCCFAKVWYDTKKLEKALEMLLALSSKYKNSDGYQYDLCDLTRQVLSNRFHDNQLEWKKAYEEKNIETVKAISQKQLELLLDIDALLEHRSEFCLGRWINDAQNLAGGDEIYQKYYNENARLLITQWGDIQGNTSTLYDYAWREWHDLIKEFYYVRWKVYYDAVIAAMEQGETLNYTTGDTLEERKKYRSTPFGETLNDFERGYYKIYKEYPVPQNSDVIPTAQNLFEKWQIAK